MFNKNKKEVINKDIDNIIPKLIDFYSETKSNSVITDLLMNHKFDKIHLVEQPAEVINIIKYLKDDDFIDNLMIKLYDIIYRIIEYDNESYCSNYIWNCFYDQFLHPIIVNNLNKVKYNQINYYSNNVLVDAFDAAISNMLTEFNWVNDEIETSFYKIFKPRIDNIKIIIVEEKEKFDKNSNKFTYLETGNKFKFDDIRKRFTSITNKVDFNHLYREVVYKPYYYLYINHLIHMLKQMFISTIARKREPEIEYITDDMKCFRTRNISTYVSVMNNYNDRFNEFIDLHDSKISLDLANSYKLLDDDWSKFYDLLVYEQNKTNYITDLLGYNVIKPIIDSVKNSTDDESIETAVSSFISTKFAKLWMSFNEFTQLYIHKPANEEVFIDVKMDLGKTQEVLNDYKQFIIELSKTNKSESDINSVINLMFKNIFIAARFYYNLLKYEFINNISYEAYIEVRDKLLGDDNHPYNETTNLSSPKILNIDMLEQILNIR